MIVPLYCNPEYGVSDEGYIVSKRDGTPMKPAKSNNGYLHTQIMLPDGSQKTIYIHSAVAKSFLGDKTIEGLCVNHIDGNKENNCLDNLEWVTPQENSQHAADVLGVGVGTNNWRAKSIYGYDKKTKELKYSFGCLSDCARAISDKTGIAFSHVKTSIWRALNGIRRSYMGCVWEYQMA